MALGICYTKTDAQGRELKEHGTALFPIACYFDDVASEAVPWHWHEELEALVVYEGTAVLAIGAEKITLRQGEGIFINSEVLHAAWDPNHAACRFHSLVFHPRLIGGIDSIFWQSYLQPLLANAAGVGLVREVPWQREALEAIEQAWQDCVIEPPGYEFTVRAALSRLVYLLCAHRAAVQSRPSEKALRDGERIKVMLQFAQAHYGEELTTTQIAQSALISESECLRCFRGTIGTTPIQYVKQFRIQKAAELLTSTDKKVVDIGALCGFQEMSYFAKTFRELRGCTPSEYRRQKEKGGSAQMED